MNESTLRAYVRQILSEISPDQPLPFGRNEYQVDGTLPKGEWILLEPGDPRLHIIRDEIWDLVDRTYASMGGHTKMSSAEDLSRYRYWVVQDLDEDPSVDVAIFGKPELGAKMGGAANDGSRAASSAYKTKSAELRSGGSVGGVTNWWGEVSGRPAYAMITRGAPVIEDEDEVARLLAGDRYEFHGEHPDPDANPVFKSVKGWYTKWFGNDPHTKIIVGNPS